MKIQKNIEGGGGVEGRSEDPVGGQGGCERRIEVIVKIQKKVGGGGGSGPIGDGVGSRGVGGRGGGG